ncbi:MAG: hypothetical protein AAGF53_06890 [Pseudomonadota bacterium]
MPEVSLEDRVSALEKDVEKYKKWFAIAVGVTAILCAVFGLSYVGIGAEVNAALNEAERKETAISNIHDSVEAEAKVFRQTVATAIQNRTKEFENLKRHLEVQIQEVSVSANQVSEIIDSFPIRAVNILSNDHKSGKTGEFFNFQAAEMDAAAGRVDWHCLTLTSLNSRTGYLGTVIAWRANNGGSNGDAHGRYEFSDDVPLPQIDRWQGGDRLFLLHTGLKSRGCN